MPRYFFHVSGLSAFSDLVGTDLANDAAAWSAAVVSCGEILADIDGNMPDGSEIRIAVRDEDERTVAIVRFTGEYRPARRSKPEGADRHVDGALHDRVTAGIDLALDWIKDVHDPQDYAPFAGDLATAAMAALEDGDRIGRDLVVRREVVQ